MLALDELIGREHFYKFLDFELFPHHDTGGGVDEHVSVVTPFIEALLDSEASRLGAAMDSGLAGNCGNGVSPSR
ncbi:MAG TPA: hypothetical protein VMZ66_09660 [Aeromicrobium sp.]|nr:hypothetical protein [Aeromicrobium sp.]